MKRKCVQCGKDFFLAKSELDFYKSRKLAYPKRCKECRAENKNRKKDKAGDTFGSVEDTKPTGIKPVNSKQNYDRPADMDGNSTINSTAENKADKKKMSKGKKALAGTAAALAVVASAVFGNNMVNSNSPDNMTLTQYYAVEETENADGAEADEILYTFKNEELLEEHFEKHGIEMGFKEPAEYEMAASKVVNNESALHKLEAEDGDDVYYLEETNELVIVSKRGYIRTYFKPEAGISYFNKQ